MNILREAMDEYLALRRSLGFKLVQAGRLLHDAACFFEARRASHITLDLALQWATQPANAQPAYWAKRLSALRGFARYHSAVDPRTEVPPQALLPYRPNRARPYLYTEQEVEQLMAGARALPFKDGLRGQTYSTLWGLLAATGLRVGEALALECQDADLNNAVLVIRRGKFGKSRLVPLHPSSQRALSQYAQQRDAWLGRKTASRFFVSQHGRPLAASSVRRTFRTLCRKAGLHESEQSDEPRLHHLRHRFAMETLLRWYRSDIDIGRKLPVLSTFLGHVSITDTYWYLSARPELMREAMQRLERRWESLS
jgi:integrase/recombinase XerD